ncbi:MAG: hypothetical protein IKA47_13230 [Oscillospiraceae bacterium]|nr:hypothetical protein [Oscillospiraceae bacterium]
MRLKRISVLLAVLVLLCATLLGACGGESGNVTYEVKVVDAAGTPCSGVIVKFLQGGSQVAMQPVDAAGTAKKELPKGDYTLELVYTDDKQTGYFDPATATVSADKHSVQLTLYKAVSGEGTDLFVGGESNKAYPVAAGGTYLTVKKQERNFFLFSPTEAGTYKLSIDNKDMKLGYYGSPFFVQEQSVEEVVDNTFTISISQSMIGTGETGTTTLVLGIDGAAEDAGCILQIIRTGDPEVTISDLPWTEYKTTHTPAPFSLNPGGKKLTYVDIKGTTEANKVVYSEADGYYHFGTADGPVVYVHLDKKAPYVSLQTVIQGDGAMGGAPIRKYFYDESGEFVKKEDYTEILNTYFENMDKNLGVYPLNADLIYIIQNGCAGWWDTESPDFILEGCNPEIGWMFALCYLA